MEILIEQVIIYGSVFIFCAFLIFLYLKLQKKTTKLVESKIRKAKAEGLFEPASLHPVIDYHKCIGCGVCVTACPEKDILGMVDGIATTIKASQCVGHGACFHACPVEGITLNIGTDKRGVDLPHVSHKFESNLAGIYIAGEMGGMGLIKNSVEQGRQAVENIIRANRKSDQATYDLIIVGAGPAGISASLMAKKSNLRFLTLEQDSLGGTVFTFPRSKLVMTAPMDLALHGKVKLFETSKSELLDLWQTVLKNNNISVREHTKVESIVEQQGYFEIETQKGEKFTGANVLLAIGRRGTPRKLGIPGENSQKVAYRLLEPENIHSKKVVVVGGGDSAVESALLLAEKNDVILSYRNHTFKRIKPKNGDKIKEAMDAGSIDVRFCTNVVSIDPENVILSYNESGEQETLSNDLVYIFAGGELPTEFLKKVGIKITRRFGYAILKHEKE